MDFPTHVQDITSGHKDQCRSFRNAKAKQTLLRTIQERKLQYFGHLIRGNGKQKLLIAGKIEGTRCRGKQRRTWTSDVTDWCGMSYMKCVGVTESRKEWSSMAVDLLIQSGTHSDSDGFTLSRELTVTVVDVLSPESLQ